MNAQLNRAAEIGVADPGTPVQHQRQAGLQADRIKPREIELRLACVFAVRIADGDGERVNAGLIDKIARQGRIGEKGFIGMAVQRTALVTAHGAQFGLHRHPHCVTHFHDFPGLANILFVTQGGAIKHHGAEA
ncbi:hypothetical protein D3C72_1634780 [compost metagenome]